MKRLDPDPVPWAPDEDYWIAVAYWMSAMGYDAATVEALYGTGKATSHAAAVLANNAMIEKRTLLARGVLVEH